MSGFLFKQQVDETLAMGNQELSMTLGVLARIKNNNYELVAVQSNSGAYISGENYRLGNTYCREIFEQRKPIATIKIDNSPTALSHPLYRSLPLECYIGAPVFHQNKPWGSLNFSSMAQRDKPFSQSEIEMVNSLAANLSGLLDSNHPIDAANEHQTE